jgi:hypothetical protein
MLLAVDKFRNKAFKGFKHDASNHDASNLGPSLLISREQANDASLTDANQPLQVCCTKSAAQCPAADECSC